MSGDSRSNSSTDEPLQSSHIIVFEMHFTLRSSADLSSAQVFAEKGSKVAAMRGIAVQPTLVFPDALAIGRSVIRCICFCRIRSAADVSRYERDED